MVADLKIAGTFGGSPKFAVVGGSSKEGQVFIGTDDSASLVHVADLVVALRAHGHDVRYTPPVDKRIEKVARALHASDSGLGTATWDWDAIGGDIRDEYRQNARDLIDGGFIKEQF